ncbi:MAG TPA: hypothetical protein VFN41_03050 [Candidatus Limnocylindrales bacterium]|nr:hypothetical protein [Candidatus Limnocylindrales bacterium]
MLARGDRPAALSLTEAVIAGVVDPFLDIDVQTADGVDHVDEALELHRRVIVDGDAEQRTDGILERREPALRKRLGVTIRVRHQGIELGAVFVPVAERHVDEVARQGHERGGLPDRVERDDHHGVGQDGRAPRCCVDADDEHVEAFVRTGSGQRSCTSAAFARQARRLEDARERVTERRSVAVHGEVR